MMCSLVVFRKSATNFEETCSQSPAIFGDLNDGQLVARQAMPGW